MVRRISLPTARKTTELITIPNHPIRMNTDDVILLTAERYLHPADPDWYVRQILTEDEILAAAFRRNGMSVRRRAWTDNGDWSSAGCVIFRAAWDYTEHYLRFTEFVRSVSQKTRMINAAETVLWNLDKRYLRDLSAKEIDVPPTLYIERYQPVTLREMFERTGGNAAILKPVMSAGARHTYKITDRNCAEYEERFQALIAEETMMIQPFLANVETQGEITLVVIDGKFTHAVKKIAKPGDFRVQDDFGGTVHQYEPTADEIAFAERAVSVCVPKPLYARVDILRDDADRPVVSELELIEPELWFRFHPPAAESLANAVGRTV